MFEKIEDFNKFLNENDSRMGFQDRYCGKIDTIFPHIENLGRHNRGIIKNVNSFYISSFAESNDGEYFLAVLNRKFCFNEHEKKCFLEEITIEEYRFKHTLLGNNEVELEKNIIYSYVFSSYLVDTIWTCKKPIGDINHDKRKLRPLKKLWKKYEKTSK